MSDPSALPGIGQLEGGLSGRAWEIRSAVVHLDSAGHQHLRLTLQDGAVGVILDLAGVTGLRLGDPDANGGLQQITGLAVDDIRDRGWEGIAWEMYDYEGGAVHAYAQQARLYLASPDPSPAEEDELPAYLATHRGQGEEVLIDGNSAGLRRLAESLTELAGRGVGSYLHCDSYSSLQECEVPLVFSQGRATAEPEVHGDAQAPAPEVDPGVLTRLQGWYRAQCDGDWEHGYGVRLQTLDNPGWSLEIDLRGTALAEREFEDAELHRSEQDWWVCWLEQERFRAACGPRNLEEALQRFLDWALQSPDA